MDHILKQNEAMRALAELIINTIQSLVSSAELFIVTISKANQQKYDQTK